MCSIRNNSPNSRACWPRSRLRLFRPARTRSRGRLVEESDMQFLIPLQSWTFLDTWVVVIGALAAMACALPGCFLLLRQQSMMGDAISHTSLLGIVAAFFTSNWLVMAAV